MKRLLPIGLIGLTACLEVAPPEIAAIDLSCNADLFDIHVMVNGDNPVANVTLDLEEDSVETRIYPSRDLSYDIAGNFSQWDVDDEPLSCDGDYTLTVTATDVMGNQTVEVAYWPIPDLSGDGLDPEVGPSTGGTEVTIYGEGFAEVSQVWFGENEATILGTADTYVLVEAPAGDVGTVDVTLNDRGTELTLPSAWTWFQDNSGLYGAMSLTSMTIYNPSLLNYASPYAQTSGPFIQMEMVLHDPPQDLSTTYFGNFPAWGDCDWGSDADFEVWNTAGSTIGLQHATLGNYSFVHATDGVVYYFVTDGIDTDNWVEQRFDLEFRDASAFIPAQTVTEAIGLPAEPTGVSLDWETANSHTFGDPWVMDWDTTGDFDGFFYAISVTTSNNATLKTLNCTADYADGSLTIPWSELTDGIDENQVGRIYAKVTWHDPDETVLPHDNSVFRNEGTLQYWYVSDIE